MQYIAPILNSSVEFDVIQIHPKSAERELNYIINFPLNGSATESWFWSSFYQLFIAPIGRLNNRISFMTA